MSEHAMPSRVIWILLFMGMLCVSMSAAQNKKQSQNTDKGGAQAPAAQTPAPASDSITELKARVDKLDKDVTALKAYSQQSTPANPVQSLQGSLQVATWVILIISVLIFASATWLWIASKKLGTLATASEVNAARDAVTNAVNAARDAVRNDVTTAVNAARDTVHNDMTNAVQAVNTARDMVHNDVTTARDMIQNSVNNVSQAIATLSQALGNVSQSVGNAKDAAHNDVSTLLQNLRETRNALQGALDELKSKINTPPPA